MARVTPNAGWWRRTLALHWALLLAASVAASVLFLMVGEDVARQEAGRVDLPVRAWMLSHQTHIVFAVFYIVTIVGSAGVLCVLGAVVSGWLFWREHRRVAAALALAPVATVIASVSIKHLLHRVRPGGAIRLHELTYAFPSGHATASTAVLVTLSYLLWRERRMPGWGSVTVGITGPLLIGFSRIYLDVHWATDVLGGWMLGLAIAGLSMALYERFRGTPAELALQLPREDAG